MRELEHVPTVAELAKMQLAKAVGGSEKSPVYWVDPKGTELVNAALVRRGRELRARDLAAPSAGMLRLRAAAAARVRAAEWAANSFSE